MKRYLVIASYSWGDYQEEVTGVKFKRSAINNIYNYIVNEYGIPDNIEVEQIK